ncbi:MAG: hypothetical protein KKC55_15770 [Gammaproteobacteria bacterium]|nr:hypothetical protein [Gammaproteobacteria bacterium]
MIIETMTKGFDKIPEYRDGMTRMGLAVNQAGRIVDNTNKSFIAAEPAVKRFSETYDSFAGVMTMSMPVWRATRESGVRLESTGARLGMSFRNLVHGARGFRMEMLSVMFFGQMLSRTFTNLLQPALETVGIFEIFRIVLLMLFLPIVLLLLPALLWIADIFMGLPDWVKLAIGFFVLFMIGLGFLLGTIGALILGLGGLVLMFGLLDMAIMPLILLIGAIILAMILLAAGLALIFTGIYMVIKGKLEGIGLIIMGIGVILLIFIGWWALIPIAVGAVVYLIIKHWKSFKAFWINLWYNIVYLVEKAWYDIKTFFGFKGEAPIKKEFVETAEAAEDTEEKTGSALDGIVGKFKTSMGQSSTALNAGMDKNVNIMDYSMERITGVVGDGMVSTNNVWLTGQDIMTSNNKAAWAERLADTQAYVGAYNSEIAKMGGGGGGAGVGYLPSGARYNISETAAGIAKAATDAATLAAAKVAVKAGAGLPVSTAEYWTGGIFPKSADFIWRPGSAPMAFSPSDTLIGTKGGAGGGIVINQTLNVNVSDAEQIRRLIAESNSRLVDDLRRITKGAI